jgi:hypothetical protein
MFSKQNLRWVTQNRRPRVAATPLGDAARRLLAGETGPLRGRPSAELRGVVTRTLPPECRARCAIGALRHGVLKLYVDDERLVQPYELQWSELLAVRILEACPGQGVCAVRFTAARRRS